MYTITHIEDTGCQYEIGCSFESEEEARSHAEDWFRKSCSLDEQLEYLMLSLNVEPTKLLSSILEILRSCVEGHDNFDLIQECCTERNKLPTDVLVIHRPEEFDVYYWAELSFSQTEGFHFQINYNG